MSKAKLLYYDILQYQHEVLRLMEDNFKIVTLPDPSHDSDNVLQSIEISIAPLGFPFDRTKMDRCPNLKVIASSTLSIPHIDYDYAVSRGIKVCYLGNEREFLETITPTAELTWGLVIAVTRRIPSAYKMVCAVQWDGRALGRKTPRMLSNMSLGIVGLGRLGSLVASYGKAFGMEVYYYSPKSKNPDFERCSTLTELAMCSDIVSIHAHHTLATEGLINRAFFRAMKPGSFIVNTSRGELIDESALLDALESGHLGGAALDVLAGEYNRGFKAELKDRPLVKYAKTHGNLIITPHYAGATVDAWEKTQRRLIETVMEALRAQV